MNRLSTEERASLDVVGIHEAAQRLGVKVTTMQQWSRRRLLPPAEATVSGHPCWRWSTIAKWADQTGRPRR